nr:cell division cycle 5-like protein [Cryptomonas paramecium]
MKFFLNNGSLEWFRSEDEILKALVNKYGFFKWKKISFFLKNKNSEICKKRWKLWLNSQLMKFKWELDQDTKLIFFSFFFIKKNSIISFLLKKNNLQCFFRIELFKISKKNNLFYFNKKKFFQINGIKKNIIFGIHTQHKLNYVSKYKKRHTMHLDRFKILLFYRKHKAFFFRKFTHNVNFFSKINILKSFEPKIFLKIVFFSKINISDTIEKFLLFIINNFHYNLKTKNNNVFNKYINSRYLNTKKLFF